MIKSITLQDFKRFGRFVIAARSGNILVGPNNSGKSSILDGFRLLAACLKYARNHKPQLLKTELGIFDGYHVPESALPFDIANITQNYTSADAHVTFDHQNGSKAHILIHPDRPVRFFIDCDGRRFSSAKAFLKSFPIDLIIVPTLSPLEAKEPLVQDETVQKNRTTRLAARSFRNIWHREDRESFARFKQKVERAWPGVEIFPPELVRSSPPFMEMMFAENRITREIQWAGFGFQVWLQIHTHLNRGNWDSILIIDEPDIYLHPDLQRRLYSDIKEQFGQFFIATHATEIINEANTDEIVVINPKSQHGRRIKSTEDYDLMFDYLGSSQNADFAKISRARRIIFVEGDDAKTIRSLAKRFGFTALAAGQKAPILRLGGFSQWRRAQDTAWAFKNVVGVEIEIACVFDRDFRPDSEVAKFLEQMAESNIDCYVLAKKEIENYLLVPSAIAAAANQQLEKRGLSDRLTAADVNACLDQCTSESHTYVSSQIVGNAVRHERSQGSTKDVTTTIQESMNGLTEKWRTRDGRLAVCGGKEILSNLNRQLQAKFRINVSNSGLISAISRNDIDGQFYAILASLDEFAKRTR